MNIISVYALDTGIDVFINGYRVFRKKPSYFRRSQNFVKNYSIEIPLGNVVDYVWMYDHANFVGPL